MWKQVRRTLLLGAILAAAAANAQNRGTSDVLFTTSINVDGSMKDLSLMHGESVEDAARSFARSNGFLSLPDERVRQVIDQLSGILKDKMEEFNAQNAAEQPQTRSTQPSVQIAIPLTIDNYSGELTKLEGETVDAAVERFLYATGFSMETMRNLYPQLINLLNQKLSELQPARKELFSFDLTIDGRPATVRHFEGGNPVEEAIATLRSIDISEGEMMDRLVPQLANKITQQLNQVPPLSQPATMTEAQNQPAKSPLKELFSIPLTINNQAVVLVHLEGATTRETAMQFLSDNRITDSEVMGSYLTQLLPILDARMSEYLRDEAAAANAAAVEEAPPQAAPARKLLVTIPINLGDNRSVNLEYYEGDSIERTVELFLANVGLGNDSLFNDNVVQLSGLVRQRLAAMHEQEQQQESTNEAATSPDSAPPLAPQAPPSRKLLVTLPINLGDNRSANLEYYEGDSIERTVELFLANVGLGNDSLFNDNIVQLSGLVRQRLAAMHEHEKQQQDQLTREQEELQRQQQGNAQASRPKPLLSLPVTLSNQVFTLEYFEGQEPAYVANTFCVEKHEIVRAKFGMQFTGDQLLECKNVLVDTITSLAAQKRQQQRQLQQEQQEQQQREQERQTQERARAQQEEQERARATAAARGDVLFTLDIDDGEGGSLQLAFHRNDNVQDAATAFCQIHNLDKSNVPLLVNAIQANLAQR
uniref:PFU domain-containing protein n=1 Tax=Globisporangium ultimum (strain ATCC 200006 / CBS 805.95 / DAOM BR144) TaxID=431595 RepID=K3W6V8_GLOUD